MGAPKDEWPKYLATIAMLVVIMCVVRVAIDYAGFFAWLR
jgi:hypothetical protein